ncbi:MAG TPA: Bax inhibitor-1/YccA family protein [Candidatus Limnocylindrales bacterium]|nr:Bax inhibitor-1/YccA family protein [Candidatus Limnocylindrales bacterium]
MSFQTTPTGSAEVRPSSAVAAAFLTQAFIWMFAGLLLTAGVSALVQGSASLLDFARQWLILVFIAQLALVVVISAGINRVPATVALGLFFVYAASLGLTVGLIVSLYTGEAVTAAFLSASAIFGGAALYGAITKRSLAGIAGALTMGLFGLIGAMVVNLFLPNGTFGWIISVGGVLLFTVFTAYDVQRIQTGALVAMTGSVEKAAVIGALRLYLDFVNLFLFLLRLMGGRR